MLTDKTIHTVGRIDQVIRDFFSQHSDVNEKLAKDFMPLFIEKGIFKKDASRPGLPIRNILRALDAEGRLYLLKHSKVIRNAVNRNWYFTRL